MQIAMDELEFRAVRSQGAGGQNVNKVATAIHLRFDINASSLPEQAKTRIRSYPDSRISADGVIVIKAQRFRSQEKNRQDAIDRLTGLLKQSLKTRKPRKKTVPGKASKLRRLNSKSLQANKKKLRRKLSLDE